MNFQWIVFYVPVTIGGRVCRLLFWENREYYGLVKITELYSAIDKKFWAIEIISKHYITKKTEILTVPSSAILTMEVKKRKK